MTALGWQPCEVVVPESSGGAALKLEARHLPAQDAAGVAVVAPPHPLYGGTLHNPVVIGIADGLARAGVAPLAFNWRGIDGSEGTRTDSLEAAVADYRAAIDLIAGAGRLYATGYSFGAAVALLAALEDPRIQGVIMLAPPVGMLRSEDVTRVAARVAVFVGDADEFAPLDELRKKVAPREDATLEVIAGADHFFHFGGLWEVPERVSAQLERWRQ